jgi:hypothetical protein
VAHGRVVHAAACPSTACAVAWIGNVAVAGCEGGQVVFAGGWVADFLWRWLWLWRWEKIEKKNEG